MLFRSAYRLVGSLVHAVSDVAASVGATWLVLPQAHGGASTALPGWMSIPGFVLTAWGAALEVLGIVVVAGIATTVYQYVTVGDEPTGGEQPALTPPG